MQPLQLRPQQVVPILEHICIRLFPHELLEIREKGCRAWSIEAQSAVGVVVKLGRHPEPSEGCDMFRVRYKPLPIHEVRWPCYDLYSSSVSGSLQRVNARLTMALRLSVASDSSSTHTSGGMHLTSGRRLKIRLQRTLVAIRENARHVALSAATAALQSGS